MGEGVDGKKMAREIRIGRGRGKFTVLIAEDGRDSKEEELVKERRRKAGGNGKKKGIDERKGTMEEKV